MEKLKEFMYEHVQGIIVILVGVVLVGVLIIALVSASNENRKMRKENMAFIENCVNHGRRVEELKVSGYMVCQPK